MIFFTPGSGGEPKDRGDVDPRIRHIDDWQSLSERRREDALGKNFFEDTKSFVTLSDMDIAPRFRPAVRIPELQLLSLKEANDLSEFSPRVYIYGKKQSQQQKDIESGFEASWDESFVAYHLLYASIWSQYTGVGFIQVGVDSYARNGEGQMWVKSRDPRSVFADPNADYTCNWSYVGWEDWMHLDEIKRRFPETGKFLPKSPTAGTKDLRSTDASSGFRLPPGPYESMPAFDAVSNRTGLASRLRTTFFKDYTRELTPGKEDSEDQKNYRWKYPRGRYIIDCEGKVLADGPSPFTSFPLIPIWSMPPLYGIWPAPPPKYTKGLQDLAGRTYTQNFENLVRTNNGIWFIPESADINQKDFGGIPGEKQTYKGQQPPTFVPPGAFPASSLQMPKDLLDLQRNLLGFTQARQGNPGSGNISPDLFDASVLRSQGLTQLRGRLMAQSVLQVAKLMVYTMIEYMPDRMIPHRSPKGFEVVTWKKPQHGIDNYEIYLDEGAFHPISMAMLRRMAPDLVKTGLLDTATGLDYMGIPNPEGVAQELAEQKGLAAVANIQRGKGK